MTTNSGERKIYRVMSKYRIEHVEDELAARWSRETDRFTLRELESWFNARVVEAAMRDAAMDPLDNEPENVRRLLADDDIAANKREQCRQRLAAAGVDPDALRSDFVSYNSIYSLLREDKELSPPESDASQVQRVKQRLRRLRERATRVTRDSLASLESNGAVAGEATPRITFGVRCSECGHRMPALEFVDNGGCEACSGE